MTPKSLERLPEVLFEIGKAIGSDKGLHHLFTTISELVCSLMEADACSVMLLDVSKHELMGKAAYGLEAGRIDTLSFRVGEGVAGWVVEHGQPALIEDCARDDRFITLDNAGTKIRSMACVPLIARDEQVGAMTATSCRLAAFNASDLELLGFIAKTIALDVENIRLRKVAVTDPLTGAYNREFLQRRLPLELEETTERRVPLSVAMIDVDHFKSVNDRFGHGAGDRVLAEVARRLREATRHNDLLVRYGGEEFLVLLPAANIDRATEVGERMRLSLQNSSIESGTGEQIEVRVSIGIAEYAGEDPTTLIRRADTALYKAKARGRNRVEVSN